MIFEMNLSNKGVYKALIKAEDFLDQGVQIMIDIASSENEETSDRIKALALVVKVLQFGKDLLGDSDLEDIPLEKLTTRSIVTKLIPDMRLVREINSEDICQKA